MFGKVHYNWH